MLDGTDNAVFAIGVEVLPARILAERGLGGYAARSRTEEFAHGFIVGARDVPAVDGVADGRGVNGRAIAMDQPAAVKFAEDAHDAAGPMDVFHMDVALGRGDLGQARHLA